MLIASVHQISAQTQHQKILFHICQIELYSDVVGAIAAPRRPAKRRRGSTLAGSDR